LIGRNSENILGCAFYGK